MKWKPAREVKLGRVFVTWSWRNLSLPRLSVMADGECVMVAFSIGYEGGDPAFLIDVNLEGTRAGRLVGEAYWKVRKMVGR